MTRNSIPLICMCMVIVISSVHGVCRNGWLRYDSSCYLFATHLNASWPMAEAYCQATKGHLLEIESKRENDFIVAHLKDLTLNTPNPWFWVGGEDFELEGNWIWVHSGEAIVQFFWAPNEPNSGVNEECLCLISWQNYLWNDSRCKHETFFICEIEDDFDNVVIG